MTFRLPAQNRSRDLLDSERPSWADTAYDLEFICRRIGLGSASVPH
jgi:hypothetical protein